MARTKQTARLACQRIPQQRQKAATGIKKKRAGRRSRSNSPESDASEPGVDYQQFSLKFDNQP